MGSRKVRIGIDVGGTFTKAVAIDDASLEIVGVVTTPTTHDAAEGVARGVVTVFDRVLRDHEIAPGDVKFLAHSTTQATNAMLEGDVAQVGIVGMGQGLDGLRARGQTRLEKIELAPGRFLKSVHTFLPTDAALTEEGVRGAIGQLQADGARVIVAAEAFGVDDPTREELVVNTARGMGLLGTGTHEISKLYGLKVRTRTAAINASILPKMLETADMIEGTVRQAGIQAPLMIMRGDGGVMDAAEMRKRPVLTMLSGPAASVAGALMYLRVSDGIFFEVGGTSVNIGVIRHGRPMVKHVELGGHSTFINSLDIRVLGVAGGSMIRLADRSVADVGPRSAHIAGLPYAAFAETAEMAGARLVLLEPRKGDPADYAAIETASGKRFALTNTCAANALGICQPGNYSYGNPEAARLAFAPLAEALQCSVAEAATRVLTVASDKVIRVIEALIAEYQLDRRTLALIGGGGGATSLIPFTSRRLDLPYQIAEYAEVISSIGVALAMVRDFVERTVVNPTREDVLRIRREAEELAISAGADPATVEVVVDIDTQKHRVRATAIGATEMRAHDVTQKSVPLAECLSVAAKSLQVLVERVQIHAQTGGNLRVLGTEIRQGGFLGLFASVARPVRVVDAAGVIRLSLGHAAVVSTSVGALATDLPHHVEHQTRYNEAGRLVPNTFLLYRQRIVDLSGLNSADQIAAMAEVETGGLPPEEPAVMLFTQV